MSLNPTEKPALLEYAYVGSYPRDSAAPIQKSTFENTLLQLKELAMYEEWSYQHTAYSRPFPILYNYLVHTFARVKEQNRVCEIDKYSCFNTGLVTENQEEIFMLFRKNKTQDGWIFQEFCKESSNELSKFDLLPERATYFEDPAELIFDPRLKLKINIDHIIEDENNFARFPDPIKALPKHQLMNTFNGAIQHALKRIRRNYKTAIPQFYRGVYFPTGQLQLLLPLCLTDPSKADLALAVYKSSNYYNGRTCLTLDMAINNARLVAKPDDEWLTP